MKNNYFKNNSHTKNKKGFGLLELLIALVIGAMIFLVLFTIFSRNEKSYTIQNQQQKREENVRYILNLVSRQIRNTGYRGCNTKTSKTYVLLSNKNRYTNQFKKPIEGHTASYFKNHASLNLSSGHLNSKSDVLTIRPTRNQNHIIESTLKKQGSSITLKNNNNNLHAGNKIVISDCTLSVISRIASVSGQRHISIVNNNGLPKQFNTGSQVNRIKTLSYFVVQKNNKSMLYEKINNNKAIPIVHNIYGLQVQFGVDTNQNKNVNKYESGHNIKNWNNVISVKIALLASTKVNHRQRPVNSQKNKVFNLFGFVYGPYNDKKTRKIYYQDITLRNRDKE